MSGPSNTHTEAAATDTTADAERADTEALLTADLHDLTMAGEQLGHAFARANRLRSTDLRALIHITAAESEGKPITAGRLGSLLGLSSAAITYLIERMIESGHIERRTDPADRRKVILRYAEHGSEVAEEFFGPLGARTRAALAVHSDEDLRAAHRVLQTAVGALREHYTDIAEPDSTLSE